MGIFQAIKNFFGFGKKNNDNGSTELHDAVKKGNNNRIFKIINEDPDTLNTLDSQGKLPIQYAKNQKLQQQLLDKGTDYQLLKSLDKKSLSKRTEIDLDESLLESQFETISSKQFVKKHLSQYLTECDPDKKLSQKPQELTKNIRNLALEKGYIISNENPQNFIKEVQKAQEKQPIKVKENKLPNNSNQTPQQTKSFQTSRPQPIEAETTTKTTVSQAATKKAEKPKIKVKKEDNETSSQTSETSSKSSQISRGHFKAPPKEQTPNPPPRKSRSRSPSPSPVGPKANAPFQKEIIGPEQ